jgi:tetratricopeptide (TPR) repeat protein
MKFKNIIIICLALVATSFAAQSFYSRYQKKVVSSKQLWFKGAGGRVAVCGSAYKAADSDVAIPALKGWGNYTWKITTSSDSARFYFNQGINMYYAFHSIEAIASFIKATRFDPQCAMAWYGKSLAMGPTINYPNGYRPPTGAYEASVQANTFKSTCSPLEKELITAMQQRYSQDSTVSVQRLRMNYAEAMQLVCAKYPKNADVVTLYADALLLLHPWDLYTHDFTAKPWTPQIRSLLEHALAINPKHPGANHYYIHTMEASGTPQAALNSAHLLDTLMPLVSHITHMPSHIYIRTGDYQRGIKDNNAAIRGYDLYLKQYAPVVNGTVLYQIHNMHLKINCAQMGGNYKTALHTSDSLQAIIPPAYLSLQGGDGNFFQYIYMQPVLTAVRFGKWDAILKIKPVDTVAYASILLHFSKGLAWCGKNNPVRAEQELQLLNAKMHDTSLLVPIDNFSSAYEAAAVARLILQGVIAETQKRYHAAADILKKAVNAEDKLIYNEPRDWPISARQYLGALLLKAGRYQEAITVFNKDLIVHPHNGWALTGLKLAYQNTGDDFALNEVQRQLKTAWKIKDMTIDKPVF